MFKETDSIEVGGFKNETITMCWRKTADPEKTPAEILRKVVENKEEKERKALVSSQALEQG